MQSLSEVVQEQRWIDSAQMCTYNVDESNLFETCSLRFRKKGHVTKFMAVVQKEGRKGGCVCVCVCVCLREGDMSL